ncbi:MAG: 50S ribosomal protein L3 [bacterium]
MLDRLLGTKIGMTQIFDQTGRVVPVSVVDVANWFVLQVKTKENDGYASLQLGLLRKKYRDKVYSSEWLKDKKEHFSCIKEVASSEKHDFKAGQVVSFDFTSLKEGDVIAVTGRSKGMGFQGVVKRWHFSGGFASHGSMFLRRPGAIGHMRTQGEVIKGKRLPGRHGFRHFTIRGLQVVRIDAGNKCLFVKGAVPGKKDTVLVVRKQGI